MKYPNIEILFSYTGAKNGIYRKLVRRPTMNIMIA